MYKMFGWSLYISGIIAFFWGLYTLISTILGANSEIAFSGAIAGIGFIATIVGFISYSIGRFILK